ncbi:MAG: hypothetical protein ABEI11_02965 [Haloarculaceae archaeon]
MSERINLVVDDSQKERWNSYVDGTAHFSSISDLIRTSVEKEISSEGETTEASIELEGELIELKDLIDDTVVSKLDEIQVDVKTIREIQEEEDIEEFAKTVFNALETAPSEENVEEVVGSKAGLQDTTLYELSQRLNSTPKRIAEAIEWLREKGYPVVSYPLDGELHYFEEV